MASSRAALIVLASRGAQDIELYSDVGAKSLWVRRRPEQPLPNYASTIKLTNKHTYTRTSTGYHFSCEVERNGDMINEVELKMFHKGFDFRLDLLFPGKPMNMSDSTFYGALTILLSHRLFRSRKRNDIKISFDRASIEVGGQRIQEIFTEDVALRNGKPIEERYKSRCVVTGELRNETSIRLPFFFTESRTNSLLLTCLSYHTVIIHVDVTVSGMTNEDYLNGMNYPTVNDGTTMNEDDSNENEETDDDSNGDLDESKPVVAPGIVTAEFDIKFVYLNNEERRLACTGRTEYDYNISNTTGVYIPPLTVSRFVELKQTQNSVKWRAQLNSLAHPHEYIMFTLKDDRGYITDLQSVSLLLNNSVHSFGSGNDFLRKIPPRYGFTLFRNEAGVVQPRHFVIPFAENPLNRGDFEATGTVNISRIDNIFLEITFPPCFKPLGDVKLEVLGRHFNVFCIRGGMGALKY